MLKKLNFQANLSPLEIYSTIRKNFDFTFILESMEGPQKFATQSVIGFNPEVVVKIDQGKLFFDDELISEGIYNIQKELSSLLAKYAIKDDSGKFIGGLVGFTSYDIVRFIEKIPNDNKEIEFPDGLYGLYLDGIHIDHINGNQIYFHHTTVPNRFDELESIISNEKLEIENFKVSKPIHITKQSTFEESVSSIIEGIRSGETFQTVLSQRIDFEVDGDHYGIYKSLREINPSPYMYYLEFGEFTIIGSSPELLISTIENKVTTFPIAGTRRLGNNEKENQIIANDLLNDEKEVAEHNMLVDLARNDIGKIAEFETVVVEEYKNIEFFSHVMHIVSKVTGIIQPGLDMFDAFFAVFPAGTVSGAPKVRSMELIEKFEPTRRGPYAGAVGYFGINNDSVQAIAIRTAFGIRSNFSIQAGAGIVLDSIPKKEYEETLNKLEALLTVLKG